MRKSNREVTDVQELLAIIAKCDSLRLAIFDEVYPYIVPLNFGEEQTQTGLSLYVHCAHEGHKIDLLRKNPKVAFEMDCSHTLFYNAERCSCTFGYESIIGTGEVVFLTSEQEKYHALETIMRHYHAQDRAFNPKVVPLTTCLQIQVHSLTGKRYTPQGYTPTPFKGQTR